MAEALATTDEVKQTLNGAGMDVAALLRGETYHDCSTVYLVPTRGSIPRKVVASWLQIARPLNNRTSFVFVEGDEVGVAYNRGIQTILDHPQLSKFRYVLTMEEDNIVPSYAHLLLLQAIRKGGFDAVGGLYFMKGELAVPMAFGSPGDLDADGKHDMQPVDMTGALLEAEAGSEAAVREVNGLACGCTLWKLDLFREIPAPWFQTMTRFKQDNTVEVVTQDIYFCRKAREAGKRFAVDARVRVGHLDVATGEVY